jgi:coenzyme F420-reducing hydrogenase alpha subunit
MKPPAPIGSLTLDVLLRDGVVRAARIGSTRRVDICRTMIGRAVAEVPRLFGRLHALCGHSHRVAARFAIATARGEPIGEAERQASVLELAGERVGEHLRATFVAFSDSKEAGLTAEDLAAIRQALAAARRMGPLASCLAHLGLGGEASPAGSWAARLLDVAGCDPAVDAGPCDPLLPADDAAVIEALGRLGVGFAQAPHLPGRRPETGAFARRFSAGRATESGPRARLAARLAEIAEASRPEASAPFLALAAGRMESRTGFAALESPRGRVHHLCSVDTQDRIAAYAVLAPTEWNFHPEGPLMRALTGLQAGEAAAAEARIHRLVALFDPCIPCTLRVREAVDA